MLSELERAGKPVRTAAATVTTAMIRPGALPAPKCYDVVADEKTSLCTSATDGGPSADGLSQ